MRLLAVNLNDAAITVQDPERVLYREPGIALLDDDQLTTGTSAFAAARLKPRRIHNAFWSELSTTPLVDRGFQHLTTADIVSQQLEQIWQKASSDGVIVAVPAYMSAGNLSLFLGIAAELGIPVAGMVDGAVAATRREYRNAVPVHVDISLHTALLTRLAQDGQVQVDRSQAIEGCGLIALYDAWIARIAEAFVKQSRFDPLHTAETEQLLQDKLPEWLAQASAAQAIDMQIEYRQISHQASIESLELVATAAPVYHRIMSSLRALYRADETPALQLSDRAARMPGLADLLTARVGGEIYLLEAGATGRGLLARCQDMRVGASAVSLVRKLPWDQSPVEAAEVGTKRNAGQPTHVLFDNRAYEIGSDALMLGLQPGEGQRRIDLSHDMPGISRRHCSVELENGQCIVRDYSRYGTFLNGHRIDGSAVLQIGDLVRIGSPGFELRLITTEVDDGS